MKIVKNKKSGTYSARYTAADGSLRSTNLGVHTMSEARDIAKKLEIEKLEQAAKLGVLSNEVFSKMMHGNRAKYSDVVDMYCNHLKKASKSPNSINTFRAIFNQYAREYKMDDAPITSVKDANLYDFINRKDSTSLANRKLRHSTLNSFFNYAMAKEFMTKNPMELINIDRSMLKHRQKEAKEKLCFTNKEYVELVEMEALPYFFREAAALSYWTGMRLGDCCSLEWDSLKKDTITVHTMKRDKRVVIPIKHELFGGDKLRNILADIEVQDKTYCFPEWNLVINDPDTRSKPSVYFKRYLERAGIYDKTFHCFRHTCITRLNKAGVQLEDIGRVVGHSDTKTTKGYVH